MGLSSINKLLPVSYYVLAKKTLVNTIARVALGLSVGLFSQFASAGNTQVSIETNHGNILVELFDEKSPITVKNFLNYVDKKHYNGTIFHRVIPRFMIQGGGFDPTMTKRPTDPTIENESKNRIHNERGTLAMARTDDPHSASDQFYINVRMNISLDYRMGEFGYAVFGKVVKGMDVVDTISVQETTQRVGYNDVPKENIVIKSISRVEQ
ncbi:MAG: peptidylprolyl isomerase [Pseudomonadales bacterium]